MAERASEERRPASSIPEPAQLEPERAARLPAPVATGDSPRHAALRATQAAMAGSPRLAALRQLRSDIEGSARVARLRTMGENLAVRSPIAASQPASPLARADGGAVRANPTTQLAPAPSRQRDESGLPERLKAGVEALSGVAMDSVKVRYNSAEPAELGALAYARGDEIHLGPGQERHLPHEAWHVAQQARGRVKPTTQLQNGVPINDDAGLEREADAMGAKALAGAPDAEQAALAPRDAAGAPLQRVSKVFVGKNEIKPDVGQGPQIFELLNALTENFTGEVWFNSGAELQNFIRSKGKVEGMGVWDGRWMNFTNKGPIIFGEEHNDIRMDFINELHITHFVVEGASERSLEGVPQANIPPSPHAAHVPYTGAGPGKALENFWVRSAQSMARFFVGLEDGLKNVDADNLWLAPVERLGELAEILRTVRGVAIPRGGADMQLEIRKALTDAQLWAERCADAGLDTLIEKMQLGGRAESVAVRSLLEEFLQRSPNGVHYLYIAFSSFRKAVEQVGYLNFAAHATPEQLADDEETRDSADPFKVWGARRELFMLKNLEAALSQSPPPLLTTMGRAHAKNQLAKLKALAHSYGGMLIIGGIVDLADIGAAKLAPISEEIAEELGGAYGWSASTQKAFAASPEGLNKAKTRLAASKSETPSYIS